MYSQMRSVFSVIPLVMALASISCINQNNSHKPMPENEAHSNSGRQKEVKIQRSDLSPSRIVKFSFAKRFQRVNDAKMREEVCGELLLHPATRRFCYRFWDDDSHKFHPTSMNYNSHDISDTLPVLSSNKWNTTEFRIADAGYDGKQYWRILDFSNETQSPPLGVDIILFNNWKDVREYDKQTWREVGGFRSWIVAAPLHGLLATIGKSDFDQQSLCQLLQGMSLANSGVGAYTVPATDAPGNSTSVWSYSVVTDNSEFGFEEIDCNSVAIGPWQIPAPRVFMIKKGVDCELSMEEFDQLCDYKSFLSRDAIVNVYYGQSQQDDTAHE